MNSKQLTEAVAKKSGISAHDAEHAVNAVLDSLRDSKHATMIFRKVDDRDAPIEQRKTIYLCG
jgi:hypothetical protein